MQDRPQTSMESRLRIRTLELMLQPSEATAYIAIYTHGGICPACGFNTERYESKVCTHIRTCKGKV
jgi:hypothetical protein